MHAIVELRVLCLCVLRPAAQRRVIQMCVCELYALGKRALSPSQSSPTRCFISCVLFTHTHTQIAPHLSCFRSPHIVIRETLADLRALHCGELKVVCACVYDRLHLLCLPLFIVGTHLAGNTERTEICRGSHSLIVEIIWNKRAVSSSPETVPRGIKAFLCCELSKIRDAFTFPCIF